MGSNKQYEMTHWFRAAIAFLALSSVTLQTDRVRAQENQAETHSILRGETLAKTNCARCHAIGLEGTSPNANAPTFRNLSSYRNIDLIYSLLLENTDAEHAGMPHFVITEEQAYDIVSWVNWVQPVPHGKRLVVANCSRCHAVDLYDESTNLSAPPFRNLSMFYPVEKLEETFAEAINTEHPGMPVFKASKNQVLDMIEYMRTLQNPEKN